MAGYRLWFQDLRGWKRFQGIPKPDPVYESFATKEEAEAKRATFPVHEDFVSTITPTPEVRSRRKKPLIPPGDDWLGGRMRAAGSKLTA